MDKEIQKELLNRTGDFINQAAHTLGATAQHVYEVLVRQQFVEGIGTIIAILLFAVTFGFSVKTYIGIAKKYASKGSYYDGFGWYLGGIFGGLVFAITLGIAVGYLAEAIQKMINPEFYAIKFIFEAVK